MKISTVPSSTWRMKTNVLWKKNRVDSRILQGLQTVDRAFVGLAAPEGQVCFHFQWLLCAHGTVFCMSASPLESHCVDSMVLVRFLRSMRVSIIFSFRLLVLLQCRNGLPIRHHRIEWYVPQSTQYLTKTCDICHCCSICPECFCNHVCCCGLSSVQFNTCTAALMIHVWLHG